jgi:hypothetical protein
MMTRPIHEYAAELDALQKAVNKARDIDDTDFWYGSIRSIVSLEVFNDLGGIIIVSMFPDDDVEFDIEPDGRLSFDERFDLAVKNVLDYFGV